MNEQWHVMSNADVVRALGTDLERGLTSAEAAARLAARGANELVERGAKSPWRILWEQFTAMMVLILIVAAVLSLVLGKFLEAVAILAIVVLFGLLGFIQEYRAERAMAALKKLAVPDRARAPRRRSCRTPRRASWCPATRAARSRQRRAGRRAPRRGRQPAHPGGGADRRVGTGRERRRAAPGGTRCRWATGATWAIMGTHGHLRARAGRRGRDRHAHRAGQDRRRCSRRSTSEQTPLQQRLDAVGKLLAAVGLAVAVLIARSWVCARRVAAATCSSRRSASPSP